MNHGQGVNEKQYIMLLFVNRFTAKMEEMNLRTYCLETNENKRKTSSSQAYPQLL